MKIKHLLVSLALMATGSMSAFAQQLPEYQQTLNTLLKINKYFMDKNPDPRVDTFGGNPTKKVRPSNLWTRAVYYEGLLNLYSVYPATEFYDYTYRWGEYHEWKLRGGATSRNADYQACGQCYIDMYRMTGERRMLQNTEACMNMLINTPMVNDWWWIDAIQMSMPILAKIGVEHGNDSRYFDKMWEMYSYTRNDHGKNGMFNLKEGLWWRDQTFDPPYTTANGKNSYWSRGNGWVYAALVRVLDEIPANETHRQDYINDFKIMSKALKKIQREDGYWNVDLGDPNNYGGKEATGTSLFIYGMAWGINHGILDRNEYLPVIAKAWNAIMADVQPDGMPGYMQGTGKEPKDAQPVEANTVIDFEDFGIGCVLLGGSEVLKIK
jgi:rhamnogalacturonyl hydrolase YesR